VGEKDGVGAEEALEVWRFLIIDIFIDTPVLIPVLLKNSNGGKKMTLVQDAMSASMPGTAKQFLGSVQPKPMGQMIVYLGILGVLPILGFLLGGLIAGGIVWGLVFGIIIAIGLIVSAIATGFILSAISQGTIGRQITPDEGITFMGYAMTPVFAVAFLGGILTFAAGWGATFLGLLLIGLAGLYSTFLVYLGATARYGQDKAIIVAILFLIISGILEWIFWTIAWAIIWNMVWGSVLGNLRGGYYGGGYTGYYGYP